MSVTTQSATLERGYTTSEARPPELTVVVLVTSQPEPLELLYRELQSAVRGCSNGVEFVVVADPGFIALTASLSEAARRGEPVRVVRVGQRMGHTGLLRAALPYCTGSIILTVPSRRRVSLEALPKLVEAVRSGADMAVASRGSERASILSGIQSRVFHGLVTRVVRTPTPISDVTSGVRAIRRELLETMPLYADSATVLPLLALREGYSVVEVPAARHTSDLSAGVQSPIVYLRSLFDLLSLFFLLRFTEKPLRFFGLVGTAALVPSCFILVLVTIQRFFGGRAAADRPLMLLGVLLLVLGVQTIALGLVGEIIVHLHASKRPTYRLRNKPDDAEK